MISEPAPAGTLPLVIGVTGHRDVPGEHASTLAVALRSVFAELQRRYPDSPRVLLSPLAEGADQIAAKVALECSIALVVPLPLPLHLYEADFASPVALNEFRALLSQADATIPLPLLEGVTQEEVSRPGAARDREYAKAGGYIAAYSHVFLALWDGVENANDQNIGGTAQIVRFRLNGVPPPFIARIGTLIRHGGAPLTHILTPRTSNPSVPPTFACSRRVPVDRAEDVMDRLLTRMEMFNGDARKLSADLAPAIADSRTSLLGHDAAQLLPRLSGPCAAVLDQFALADCLSVHYGRKTLAAWKQVFVGVFAAAILVNLHSFYYYVFFASASPESPLARLSAFPWFLWLFLGLSGFTVLRFHRRAEKEEYQNKHQDYRALAEALRVQFYWLLAGVTEPVAHRYLRKVRSDLEWIRKALQSSCVLMHARRSESGPLLPQLERLRIVQTQWIANQRNYYAGKAIREQRTLDRETALGRRLLQASVLLAAGLALALSAGLIHPIHELEILRHAVESRGVSNTIEFLMVILAVGAGLLVAYGDQMARAEHVRQFTRMGELFGAAETEFVERLRMKEFDSIDGLATELGLEALDESGDWLILHRDRPLEVPHAG